MRNELLQLFGRKITPELDRSRLPEFMDRYLEIATSCTDARPGLLLTAWLPFCGVNAGNRVHMYNNTGRLYPNIWSCVIGPSGIARKTTAISYARYTIRDFERDLRQGSVDDQNLRTLVVTSSTLSVLLSQLAINPSRLLLQNEFSGWMADISKNYNAGYKQHITDIYDNKDRVVKTLERTDIINDPALSVVTASTEGWFMKHMAIGAEQLSGFLQRMVFFVMGEVDYSQLNLEVRDVKEMEERLACFDRELFQWWRGIPFTQLLELSPAAKALRDERYLQRHREYFDKRNDTLMSYFTRVHDGYFYKFSILNTLACHPGDLGAAVRSGTCPKLFNSLKVSEKTAREALYLCDYYMANTTPLLALLDEQSALAGERKLIELITVTYGGRVAHSKLMNASHMRKKDFKENIESLLDREAIRVETVKGPNNKNARVYVADPELMRELEKYRKA
ncbi:MAG: DUF3987 domain-containing protein [Candidatus Syntrophosphaera sp.]|nr:DUF3987 domain-containing protein [Candidatus Syntrophosphaera sp.]